MVDGGGGCGSAVGFAGPFVIVSAAAIFSSGRIGRARLYLVIIDDFFGISVAFYQARLLRILP